MIVVDTEGTLLGAGWFDAKDTWSCGCQSFVAILLVKGSDSSSFTTGTTSLPSGTARDPFYRKSASGARSTRGY